MVLALSVNGVDVRRSSAVTNNEAPQNNFQLSNGHAASAQQAGGVTVAAPEIESDENFKTKSVLQGKLSNLAIQIGYIGSVVAVATVIILIVRYCITQYAVKKQPFRTSDIVYFVNFIIVGVTVLVIAVPEGLPLAITLALTYSVKKVRRSFKIFIVDRSVLKVFFL